jgi:hypothetical protein
MLRLACTLISSFAAVVGGFCVCLDADYLSGLRAGNCLPQN